MDFRSQLSAFANKSSPRQGGDRGGDRGDNRGRDGGERGGYRGRSPNSRSPHYNRYSNDNNRGGGGGGGNGGNYYGRGGGGSEHPHGGDRRRQRPGNWNHHQQGPPNQRRRHNSPDRDGLGGLRLFGYRIPRGVPPPPTPEQKAKRAKHIALLAITIDDMPYEHIWKAWCQTINPPGNMKDNYFISLICHAKYPKNVQSEWLKQRILVYPPKVGRGNSYLDPDYLTRTPNWGSVEITRAMLDLLQNGLKVGHCRQQDKRFSANRFLVRRPEIPLNSEEEVDNSIPPVDQFLYISETCVPVVSAQDTFHLVSDTTVSWVNARHRKDPDTPKNAYENDQFGMINRRVPGQFRWKADQWVLLSRQHAQQIMNMDRPHIPPKHQLWQSFRDINASDEMYIPTCLAMLGWLRYAADGEDTQKTRGEWRPRSESNTDGTQGSDDRKGGGSNGPVEEGNKAVNAEKASIADDAVVWKPPQRILKRPVTYTDWSEGMRNPATFVKGMVDFRRVARLAREKGCLVARKFAPYEAVPGVVAGEQKVTGQFSVEEWEDEIWLLAEEFKVEVPEEEEPEMQKPREEEVGKDNTENKNDEVNIDSKADKNDSGSSSGEEQEGSFLTTVEVKDEGEGDEAGDEEDEENQLE